MRTLRSQGPEPGSNLFSCCNPITYNFLRGFSWVIQLMTKPSASHVLALLGWRKQPLPRAPVYPPGSGPSQPTCLFLLETR